jgi:hypothetical protein
MALLLRGPSLNPHRTSHAVELIDLSPPASGKRTTP